MALFPTAGAAALMARGLLLIAAGACSLFNGFSQWPLFGLSSSPVFDSVDQILGAATRGYPFATTERVYYYGTPLLIAVITLLIAGIPAAIYERIRGLKTSTPVSLGIWLIATILLTLPTIMRAISED